MSIKALYKELGVDYSQKEQDQFFKELIDIAETSNKPFGATTRKTPKHREGLVNEIKQMQEEIKSCTAEFSHHLDVYPLSEKVILSKGYDVPPDIAIDMKKFQFALVNIPITLVPIKGWGFNALDCIVSFNPDRSVKSQPVAHQLFPSDVWEEKIKASQELSIGVDEFFNFKVAGDVPQVASAVVGAATGVDAAAGVGADGKGGFKLVLGPYNYSVRLPKVIAHGSGNSKVRWRLEGEENIQQHDLKLGVVLKVPRQAKKVEVVGVMTLSRTFHTFTTDVKYLFEYISSRSKEFFKQGAPPKLPPRCVGYYGAFKGGLER